MAAIRGRHCHGDIDAVVELHALEMHDCKEHADESLRRMADKQSMTAKGTQMRA